MPKGGERLTEYQLQILMERFQVHPYVKEEEQHHLAKSLNISEKKIRKWFSNRRNKEKTKGMLSKGELLFSNVQLVYS